MALGPGSIAFVGFNADGADNLAFVGLETIAAGTVIHFTDNEWNGSAFTAGESTWSWTASVDVAAGTVVAMDGLFGAAVASSNLGAIGYIEQSERDISASVEAVYAYVGAPNQPASFLAAISNGGFSSSLAGLITNTGLAAGATAINLALKDSGADIAVYAGPTSGRENLADYPALINNPANWVTQDASGDQSVDGAAPDVPFPVPTFTVDPNAQTIEFAAESLRIEKLEGDAGASVFTFTVVRNGTNSIGDVNFSGVFSSSAVDANDFGSVLPASFSGTIPAGANEAAVTVTVMGDTLFEPSEAFTLNLQSVTNSSANAVIGDDALATGIIVNDDNIGNGQVVATQVRLSGADELVVEAGGAVVTVAADASPAVQWTGPSTGVTISNSGTISSTYQHTTNPSRHGTAIADGQQVAGGVWNLEIDNKAGGVITAVGSALDLSLDLGGGAVAVTNEGTISATRANAIALSAVNGAVSVENGANGLIGSTADAVNVSGDLKGGSITFENDGAIRSTGASGNAIDLSMSNGALTVTNGATGVISALTSAVTLTGDLNGGAVSLENSGLIGATDAFSPAVNVAARRGTIDIDNNASGTISAASEAIVISGNLDGGTVEVRNAGMIRSMTTGNSQADAIEVLASGGTIEIENSGRIEAAGTGSAVNLVTSNGLLSFTNEASGLVSGNSFGLKLGGADGGMIAVVNEGRILATAAQGRAVDVGSLYGGATLTIENAEGATISAQGIGISGSPREGAILIINNGGTIEATAAVSNNYALSVSGAGTVVNNNATGVITSYGATGMRIGDATLNNAGRIFMSGSTGDAIVVGDGFINNMSGGVIEGRHHAVTGSVGFVVDNDANATLRGLAGSGVNIDNDASAENTVRVTNRGLISGEANPSSYSEADGDAVDVDGLAFIENYGTVQGMGAYGTHKGEANVSEGIAIGGGTINNYAGGTIYGYGRAIQVDNSGNGASLGSTAIYNEGLIRGDGNGPTMVTSEQAAKINLVGNEAINLVGGFDDEITNKGQIVGGVAMGGGNDVMNVYAGSSIAGRIDGGDGNDTLKLVGQGVGSMDDNTNFENLNVQSGIWSLQSDSYDSINVAPGAIVTSQLKLADQGEMKVAQGGSVLVTNGSDAVVAEGSAAIENAGLIQALGQQGATPARAISISGGTVYNKVGGIILAQGVAIASSAAPAPGAELVNGGLIQSLSGQAIAFTGDEGDLLVNTRTGAIVGSVSTGGGNDLVTNQGSIVAANGTAIDLGDGNDILNLHDGSTITGKIVLGAGNDVLSSQSASNLVIEAGDGQDSIATGSGNDRIVGGAGIDLIHAGAGNDIVDGGADNDQLRGADGDDELNGDAGDDYLEGGNGNDKLYGGAGNDQILAGSGDQVRGDDGDDAIEVAVSAGAPASIDGGEGNDTVKLLGTGAGVLGVTTGVENLLVLSGSWSVATGDYSDVTIENGATVTSTITLNNNDQLTVEAGGKLVSGTAINWAGGGNATVDNSGLIEASSRVFNTTVGATGSFIFNNNADGVVRGAFSPQQRGDANAAITINNAGMMEASGRVIDLQNLVAGGADAVINNLAGGTIRQTGSDTDVIRPGQNTVVNNWGTITTAPGFAGGGDLIDFQSGTGGKVNNYAGGWMEGSRHAVTGDNSVTVYNAGMMIGRNGSAVNIDNGGSEAEKVFVTNHGTIEGRSAELSDSDGDAIDVDGLAQILNYGRIAGLGHEGYHDGEPNVSEGIAIGGGTVVNNAAGEIYGYGRAIQVDNSSNQNALGATTIVNDGLIRGDGHGPQGVSAGDAARFDLRGNEAINLVGEYEDWVINNSGGRIVGGISMGGARDTLNNSGSIVATGGSAIDMGSGNDQVNLYIGATVQGVILLGGGDDVALSTSAGSFVIDGGDGNDSIFMSSTVFGGDDVLSGGAGNDYVYGGIGEDRIDGGSGNDTLAGESGDDLIEGGSGDDSIDGGADDDVIFGDEGNDAIIGGLGNDVIKGGAGNDTFIVQVATDGRDSYDGGSGVDTLDFSALSTAVNLTLKDGTSTYATDTIENIENVVGGSVGDKLTGNSLDNVLRGNAGDDTLNGGAGNDQLFGGQDNDTLKGTAGNDLLDGGDGNDDLDGGADNDILLGGAGHDTLKGGAGNDTLRGGAGNDTLTGGAGFDVYVFNSLSDGVDTITDFKISGSSVDQIQLSASMFQNFSGDDAFDLIGGGFLRATSSGGATQLQIDVDGGGDHFVTFANLSGTFSNGIIADHLIVQQDPVA